MILTVYNKTTGEVSRTGTYSQEEIKAFMGEDDAIWEGFVDGQYDKIVDGKIVALGVTYDIPTYIRIKRDLMLEESDWTQLQDVAISAEKLEQWKEYRLKLRELPETFKDAANIEDVTFPETPTK